MTNKLNGTPIEKKHYRPFRYQARMLKGLMPNGKTNLSFSELLAKMDVRAGRLYKLCDHLNSVEDIKYVLPKPKPIVRDATITPLGATTISCSNIDNLGLSDYYKPGVKVSFTRYGEKGILVMPGEDTAIAEATVSEANPSWDDIPEPAVWEYVGDEQCSTEDDAEAYARWKNKRDKITRLHDRAKLRQKPVASRSETAEETKEFPASPTSKEASSVSDTEGKTATRVISRLDKLLGLLMGKE